MKWFQNAANTSVVTGEDSAGKSKIKGPDKTKSSMTLSERVAELEKWRIETDRKVAEHERRVSALEAKERTRK